MASYQVLTGKKYDVVADTPEQAEQKYHAYIAGEDCPCGVEDCSCVEFNEIDTLVIGGEN